MSHLGLLGPTRSLFYAALVPHQRNLGPGNFMNGFGNVPCSSVSPSKFHHSFGLLLGTPVVGLPGVDTVWFRTSSDIEVPNHETVQSKAIISVVIETTAPSTPLKLITTSISVPLKNASSANWANISGDNFPNWVSLTSSVVTGLQHG